MRTNFLSMGKKPAQIILSVTQSVPCPLFQSGMMNWTSDSEPHTHKQSTFQAHALLIHSKDQAAAALNAIYQNPHLATATHHMYAYKIGVTGENVESGYSDDNEIKGGQTLMDLINEKKSSNILICVTRLKEGPNIGPKRFELIKKCANELLSSEDVYEDPVFNHVMFS